jgi:hypothetical protein
VFMLANDGAPSPSHLRSDRAALFAAGVFRHWSDAERGSDEMRLRRGRLVTLPASPRGNLGNLPPTLSR